MTSTRLTSVVRSDEAEDVLVPEHDGLVDLAFPEPRLLIPAAEDLDGHVLAAPVAEHHLAEAGKGIKLQWRSQYRGQTHSYIEFLNTSKG